MWIKKGGEIVQEVYTLDQIKRRLHPVLKKNHVRKATIFGSYSKGLATSGSDIDILVDSGLHGLSFFGLLEDVCQSLERDVDLIDTADIIPNSKIDHEIKKTGIVIYEQ